MKKNSAKLIAIVAAIILIIATYFFYTGKYHRANSTEEKTVNQNIENTSNNENADTKLSDTANENTNKETTLAEKPSTIPTEIPVLMFHYVRDLNDPNDKIGTNLSVSPAKFASELDLIKSKGYETITFKDIDNRNVPNKPIILTFDDGYKDFYQNAYPELKKRNMKAVSFIITDKIGAAEYMDGNEIKEISSYGIEIGSHTLSHPDLSKSSNEKAKKEIAESKKVLEDIIGKGVISFCYPSGKYTSETEELVRNAGYKYAVTTNGGITSFNDYLALNRYRVNPNTNIGAFLK